MTANGSQLEAFLRQIPQHPESPPRDPNEPRVTLRSALRLTREQEERAANYFLDEKRRLEDATGRNHVMNGSWLSAAQLSEDRAMADRSFMGRRELYQLLYRLELDWRPYIEGGIYDYSNEHLPMTHRLLKQQIARAQNFFFDTEPWLAGVAIGSKDDLVAKAVDRWAKWGLSQAEVKEKAFEPAIESAFVLGEQVVKDTWKVQVDHYETWAEVLVGPDNEPVRALDGDYIYRQDTWIPDEQKGVFVLGRDQRTPLPNFLREPRQALEWFDVRLVPKRRTIYRGVDIGCVFFKDILVPIDATSIQEATTVIHLYDRDASAVAHEYLERMERSGDRDDLPRVVELLRSIAGGTDAVSASRQPRPDLSETNVGGGFTLLQSDDGSRRTTQPTVGLAECWGYLDINSDGRLEHVMMLIDLESQRPVFYDYVSNLTPDGQRPFHVVRVNPIANRWHGVAQTEFFWRLNQSMDLNFNRICLAHSKEGRVDAVNHEAVYEGDDNPHLEVNGDITYHLKEGFTIDDFVSSKYLTDVKTEHVQGVIDYLMQFGTNMSGVSNANDAQAAGLDSTALATGIRHLEMAGQELFSPFLKNILPGIKSATRQAIYIMRANMDDEETYRYFSDDEWMSEALRAVDIQDLRFDVEIVLSKNQTIQEFVQLSKGIELSERYVAYPPEMRMAMRAWYTKTLELMKLPGVDTVMDILDQMMPQMVATGPIPMDGIDGATKGASRMVQPSV